MEQVSTKARPVRSGLSSSFQTLNGKAAEGLCAPPAIMVHRNSSRRRSRRRKKGGWKARTGLTRQQVSDLYEAARVAWSMCAPLNVVVTFNPPAIDSETAASRKRRLSHNVDALRQALERRGQRWRAVTVWQHPIGGRLHCHALCHVEPNNDDVASRFDDRPAVQVQPWGRDVGYFTRERLPNGTPTYESRKRWKRVKGQPIKGQRLTISSSLKAAITEDVADRQHITQQQQTGQRQALSSSTAVPVQLDLFGSLPALPATVFDLVAERKRRGLSQYALAAMVGLRQPHIANCERGHDRLSTARIRVVRHVLAALPTAA